jgi:hypothetical protein
VRRRGRSTALRYGAGAALTNGMLLPLITLGGLAIIALSVPIIVRGASIVRSGVPHPMPKADHPAHSSARGLRSFTRKQGTFLLALGLWCAFGGALVIVVVATKFGVGSFYGHPAAP